jgi:hypothetical protein
MREFYVRVRATRPIGINSLEFDRQAVPLLSGGDCTEARILWALAALQRATQTIPIVFVQIADPVAIGYVASTARPGGNITGFALHEFSIATAWVELLKQLASNVTRIAALYDPGN